MGQQDKSARHGGSGRSETAPLLSSSAGPDRSAPATAGPASERLDGRHHHHHHHHRRRRPQRPARLYRGKVLVMLFLVVILIELGSVVLQAPINAIMEDNICHEFLDTRSGTAAHAHANANNSTGDDDGYVPGMFFDDPRCKVPDVQGRLAMVRGWQLGIDVVPNMIGAIPYGLMGDLYGRKPVLILGLAGTVLSSCWTALVLALPSVLPLRAVYLSSAFTFIGAFGCAGTALLYTCIADVTPQAGRASVFFQATVTFLAAEMVGSPLSAWLMRSGPWLAMLVGLLISFASLVVMCFAPETIDMTLDDDDDDDDDAAAAAAAADDMYSDGDEDEDAALLGPSSTTAAAAAAHTKPDPDGAGPLLRRTLVLAAASFRELWVFVLGNSRLAVLMLPLSFFLLGRLAQESLLQYSTKRYGLTWADATFVMTVRSLSNIVLFVAVFPALSRFCTEYLSMSALCKDLSLARAAGLVGALGALLVALSPTPLALMCSLVVFSFGYGFAPFVRSLLNALVEQRHLAMLNSCISFIEMCGTLVAAPGLSAALGLGVRLGGPWIGLPFMLSSLGFAVATAMVCAYRLPPQPERPPRHHGDGNCDGEDGM